MRIPNQLKVAAATVLVVGGVSHSMLPALQDKTDPAKVQQEYTREYNENRKRELGELRAKGEREGQAIYEEQFRPVESRPKTDESAEKVMRNLLRRRP